ncbi:hypothetical protein GHA01_30130 [Novacetimonas hansenii]|uniref:Uncharacterized protein n=1 Tax=Novacetimonas hansenii TaxID=436 RepID=A0ABQ0SIL0_NOVHA|nr:hypothetical protein Gaha_0019_003 [Novacetimonas hansenii JCM 7643]GBQ60702.1 hypothetical protein AA0243_2414 [Novacetimonas hansenii NRIC 0243]GEC65164.1 hypothetical protein GHA01_30130 [Novacetimonas hansenii]
MANSIGSDSLNGGEGLPDNKEVKLQDDYYAADLTRHTALSWHANAAWQLVALTVMLSARQFHFGAGGFRNSMKHNLCPTMQT